MRLIDELRLEHHLIERVAGSLRVYARALARGEAPPGDAARFLEFFQVFAGRFHHGREEDTLFVALERDAELPATRGPIAAMLDNHHRMGRLLDEMAPSGGTNGSGRSSKTTCPRARAGLSGLQAADQRPRVGAGELLVGALLTLEADPDPRDPGVLVVLRVRAEGAREQHAGARAERMARWCGVPFEHASELPRRAAA